MKKFLGGTFIIFAALFGSQTFANQVVTLKAGTSITVNPGEATTVACEGGTGSTVKFCTCERYSQFFSSLILHFFIDSKERTQKIAEIEGGGPMESLSNCQNVALSNPICR